MFAFVQSSLKAIKAKNFKYLIKMRRSTSAACLHWFFLALTHSFERNLRLVCCQLWLSPEVKTPPNNLVWSLLIQDSFCWKRGSILTLLIEEMESTGRKHDGFSAQANDVYIIISLLYFYYPNVGVFLYIVGSLIWIVCSTASVLESRCWHNFMISVIMCYIFSSTSAFHCWISFIPPHSWNFWDLDV